MQCHIGKKLPMYKPVACHIQKTEHHSIAFNRETAELGGGGEAKGGTEKWVMRMTGKILFKKKIERFPLPQKEETNSQK